MSSNTRKAAEQGRVAADEAHKAASALGLQPPIIIYYDMEN
jgi:hypothetical protein